MNFGQFQSGIVMPWWHLTFISRKKNSSSSHVFPVIFDLSSTASTFSIVFHTETTESSPHIRSRAPTSPSNPWDLHRQTLLLERIWDELLHSHPQKDRKVNPGFKFPWRLVTFLSSWGYFRSFLKGKSCEYCRVHENLNQGKESSTWLHNNNSPTPNKLILRWWHWMRNHALWGGGYHSAQIIPHLCTRGPGTVGKWKGSQILCILRLIQVISNNSRDRNAVHMTQRPGFRYIHMN
jgi:hypothetical protein